MEQIAPFEAEFHLGQEVTVVKPVDDAFDIETSAGTRFRTKTVFLAGGVGSFQPRRMRLEGIEAYEDKSLFYKVRDPKVFEGKAIAILGGGDSALDWVLGAAAHRVVANARASSGRVPRRARVRR